MKNIKHKLKVGALFMQMGTGKTRVAIELVDYNKCDLLLYVAPFSTLKNIVFDISLKRGNIDLSPQRCLGNR